MKTLRSYVEGRWHEADGGFATLVDPCSEEPVARASSEGVDFAAAIDHARNLRQEESLRHKRKAIDKIGNPHDFTAFLASDFRSL